MNCCGWLINEHRASNREMHMVQIEQEFSPPSGLQHHPLLDLPWLPLPLDLHLPQARPADKDLAAIHHASLLVLLPCQTSQIYGENNPCELLFVASLLCFPCSSTISLWATNKSSDTTHEMAACIARCCHENEGMEEFWCHEHQKQIFLDQICLHNF